MIDILPLVRLHDRYLELTADLENLCQLDGFLTFSSRMLAPSRYSTFQGFYYICLKSFSVMTQFLHVYKLNVICTLP